MKVLNYILRISRGFVYYLVLAFLKIRYGIRPKGMVSVKVTIKNRSFDMVIDLNDKGLSNDIYYFRIREYPNVIHYANYLQKNGKTINTIFDIGANIGFYVLIENLFLNNSKQSLHKIIAVEPVKENIRILRRNIKYNLLKNIIIRKNAVGDRNTKIKILVPKHRNLSRIEGVGKKENNNIKSQTVNMQTLPFLFQQNKIKPQNVLIRMDIEGYEYNLLMNNKAFIKKLKGLYIVFEFHAFYLGVNKTIKFLNYLKNLGFEVDKVVSCEPLYFLYTPKIIRELLKKSWLTEYKGRNFGLLKNYNNFNQLIQDAKNRNNAIYNYPNLHLYLHKR